MKLTYYQKYLMVNHLVTKLGWKVMSGQANAFEHRAWIRGYFFKEYLMAKSLQSVRLIATERQYLETLSMWWCPKCYRPIRWPPELRVATDIFGVRHYPSGAPPTNCEFCWDKEEAEDNRPARQPADIQ